MDLSEDLIRLQVRPGLFHDKFMQYYYSLPAQDKVLFKKTLRPVLPYISTMEEAQDFLFWLNGTDPIYISNKIKNNEFAYDLPKAMVWEVWNGVLNRS